MMKAATQLVAVIAMATTVAGLSVNSASAHIDDFESRTLAVNVQDLDLNTARGQEVLRRRIKWAADIVCGIPNSRDLRMLADYHACVNEATSGALAQIQRPRT
jgi:UrcA family protein